jgi:hypothetical protein
MELRDEKDGWQLSLQDGLVQLIQIDFRLGLFLSDASGKAQLYVEAPCHLRGPDVDVALTPAESSSLAPVLPLFNAKVTSVAIRNTGQLKVQFGDSCSLEVDPDDAYEAWQLGCSLGFMLVCSPGGKVSFFKQTERPPNAN